MEPSPSKLQLEALQTVMSHKPTDPRQSMKVFLDENNPSSGILKRCFNVVLCYSNSTSEDSGVCSGSVVTGWIKESLGKALSEQPMIAGRLRPDQDGKGEFEIVSNDSGVRLFEAKLAMSLVEFLDLKEKKEVEAELVFWEDLDHEQNPQFSPLFYVQLTKFSCGGYSIGISCSLLLVDPFAAISFLKRWSEIHIEIISRTNAPKFPNFYRPYFRNNGGASPGLPFGSNTKPYPARSVIFTIPAKILDLDGEIHKKLAAICIDEAEQESGQKTGPDLNFSVLMKDPISGDVKVGSFARNGLTRKPSITAIRTSENWEDFGVKELCFQEGNKPSYVSCWVNSVPDEALMIIVSKAFPEEDSSGMKIVLTLPVTG